MNNANAGQPANNFPSLRRLRLTANEMDALASQGFVRGELQRGKSIFKLRFRCDGKQRVRYLGGLTQAQAIEAELAILQRDLRLRRRLSALRQSAWQRLRDGKLKLTPPLEARNFYYHGFQIRKRRCPTVA